MNAVFNGALSGAAAQRMGWALVHFLWQGAAVVLVLAVTLRLLRRRSAQARWLASCVALGVMAALPAVTACLVAARAPGPAAQEVVDVAAEGEPVPAPALPATAAPLAPVDVTAVAAAAVPSPVPWPERAHSLVEPVLPWVVTGWLAGVLALSVWHVGGWRQLHRSRRLGTRPAGEAALKALGELIVRLRVSRPVRLLESARVAVPAVVGWLRPVILLPATAVTGLTPEQLRAVLAHELAHVRRWDCLVRLVQAVVETLLFYHPGVWWVSGQIRQESEHCCDELAVSVCGDPRGYARALARAAELAARVPRLAVASTGGDLLARIRRIVGLAEPREAASSRWLAGFLTLGALLAVLAVPCVHALGAERSAIAPPDEDGQPITVTVSGRVIAREGGAPIPGASVRAYLFLARIQSPERVELCPEVTATSDADGRYRIALVAQLTKSGLFKGQDSVWLSVGAPGYETRPYWVRPSVSRDNTDFRDVDVDLAPGRLLSGRAVDEEGAPLADALVMVGGSGSGAIDKWGALGRTRTDRQGSFALWIGRAETEHLGRRAWLVVWKEGYGAGIRTRIMNEQDIGELTIPRGGTIRGRVVGRDGQGVPGCEVRAVLPFPVEGICRTVTDADGRYELHGIPGDPTIREFMTWKNGRFGQGHGDAEVFACAEPRTRLEDAPNYGIFALEGDVLEAPDLAVAGGASVRGRVVSPVSHLPVQGLVVTLGGWDSQRETDGDGSFNFPWVRPGKRELQVYLPTSLRLSRHIGSAKIDLKPGQALEGVEVPLEPLAQVHVQFVDVDGRPVEGIAAGSMRNRLGSGPPNEGTRSGVDGRAMLYMMPGQTEYVWGMDWDGMALDTRTPVELTPKPGEVIHDVRIVMVPFARMAGRALDEAGEAIAEERLTFAFAHDDGLRTFGEATTDARGRFEVEHISPGEAEVTVQKWPGGKVGSAPLPFRAAPGGMQDIGQVVLRATGVEESQVAAGGKRQ